MNEEVRVALIFGSDLRHEAPDQEGVRPGPRPAPANTILTVKRGAIGVFAFTDKDDRTIWSVGRILALYLDNKRSISVFWMIRDDSKKDATAIVLFAKPSTPAAGTGPHVFQLLESTFYSLRTQLICLLDEEQVVTTGRKLGEGKKGYKIPVGAPKNINSPYIRLAKGHRDVIETLLKTWAPAPVQENPLYNPTWRMVTTRTR